MLSKALSNVLGRIEKEKAVHLLDDFHKMIETLALLVSAGSSSESVYAFFVNAKILPLLGYVFKTCSEWELNMKAICPSAMPVEQFEAKLKEVASKLTMGIKSMMKKDNPANSETLDALFQALLKPITVTQTTAGFFKLQ